MSSLDGPQSTSEQKEFNTIGLAAPDVTKPTANNLGYVMNSEKQSEYSKEQQLEDLRNNLYSDVHLCFLQKIGLPNGELGNFRDPSANKVKEYVNKGIEVGGENVKGVLYMNPCFCLSLYLIKKLKENYPDLSENIKLNIEILAYNNQLTAHAFVGIDDEMGNPLIIDFARNNDTYIYRGEYNNGSKGVKHYCTIEIPSSTFGDDDTIYSIAVANKDEIANVSKGKLPHGIILTPDVINKMLDARLEGWKSDNQWDETGKSPNYEEWKKINGNSPVYCFKNVDENGEVKEEQFKVDGNKVSIKIGQDRVLYNGSMIDSIIWADLKIKNKEPLEIYAKYPDGDRLINFNNNEIYKFLTSIATQ